MRLHTSRTPYGDHALSHEDVKVIELSEISTSRSEESSHLIWGESKVAEAYPMHSPAIAGKAPVPRISRDTEAIEALPHEPLDERLRVSGNALTLVVKEGEEAKREIEVAFHHLKRFRKRPSPLRLIRKRRIIEHERELLGSLPLEIPVGVKEIAVLGEVLLNKRNKFAPR
jgi:hypothetical protein